MADLLRWTTPSRVSTVQSEMSDVSERPYSELNGRPLSREIENIKALIGRSYGGDKRKIDGSITAQVFRRRGSAVDVVSRDRIYHELDLLKKRIKADMEEEVKRLQLDDFEPHTDFSTPEILDAREREYLHTGNGLRLVNMHQKEISIDDVGSRIGSVSSERDSASRSPMQSNLELEKLKQETDSFRTALQEAGVKTVVLDSQLKDVRTHLDMARVELETVRTERRDAQAKYEWAMAEKNEFASKYESLQGHILDMKKQLATTDSERCQASASALDAQQRMAELERRVGDAETKAYQGNRLHESRQREHQSALAEYKARLEQAILEAQQSSRGHQQAVLEQESLKQQMEQISHERSQFEIRLEALLNDQDGSGRDKNDAETWRYSQMRQLDRLQSENDHTTNTLRREIMEIKNQSRSRLADVNSQLSAKTKEVQAAQKLLGLREDALATSDKRYQELEVLVQLKDSELDRLREETQGVALKNLSAAQSSQADHSEELTKLRQEYEDRFQQLKDSYTQKRERMLAGHRAALDQISQDAEQRHQTVVSEMTARHAGELESAHALSRSDIASVKQQHQQALTEMRAAHKFDRERIASENKTGVTALKAEASKYRRICQDLEDYAAVEIARLQTEHDGHVRELEKKWADELEAISESRQLSIEEMRKEYEMQLQDRQRTSEDDATDSGVDSDCRVNSIKTTHESEINALQEQLARMAQEHKHALDAATAQHDVSAKDLLARIQELESAVKLDDERRDKEIQDIVARHAQELADLHERHKTHLSLIDQQEKSSDVRARGEQDVGSQTDENAVHQSRIVQELSGHNLQSLQARLSQTNAEMQDLKQKHDLTEAEVVDLRARLDAELSAHAEAERALAVVRKQRAEDEQKHKESMELFLQKQIVDLRREKEKLNQQHRHSLSSLLDLKPRSIRFDVAKTSPAITEEQADDAILQDMRIKVLQQELDTAQNSLKEHEHLKDEIGRQNEFLVKEVEVLMARLNSRNNTPIASKTVTPLVVPEERDGPISPFDNDGLSAIDTVSTKDSPEPQSDATPSRESRRRHQSSVSTASTQYLTPRNMTPLDQVLSVPQSTQSAEDVEAAREVLMTRHQAHMDKLFAQKERREQEMSARANSVLSRERAKLRRRSGRGDMGEDELEREEQELTSEFKSLLEKKKAYITARYVSEVQKSQRTHEREMRELAQSAMHSGRGLLTGVEESDQSFDQSDFTASPIFDNTTRSRDSIDSRARNESVDLDDNNLKFDAQWPLPYGFTSPPTRAPTTRAAARQPEVAVPRALPYPYNRRGNEKEVRAHVPANQHESSRPSSRRERDVRQVSMSAARSRHGLHDSGADSEVFERQSTSDLRSLPSMSMRDPYRVNGSARSNDGSEPDLANAGFGLHTIRKRPEVRQPTVPSTLSSAAKARQHHGEPAPRMVRTAEPRSTSAVRSTSTYAREQTSRIPRSAVNPADPPKSEPRTGKSFTHSSASLFAPKMSVGA